MHALVNYPPKSRSPTCVVSCGVQIYWPEKGAWTDNGAFSNWRYFTSPHFSNFTHLLIFSLSHNMAHSSLTLLPHLQIPCQGCKSFRKNARG